MIDTPRCSLNFIPLSSLPNCSLFEISTLKLFGSQLAIFPFQSTKPSLAFYRPTYYQAFSQQPQKPCCLNGRISTKDSRRQSSTRILDPGRCYLHLWWYFSVNKLCSNSKTGQHYSNGYYFCVKTFHICVQKVTFKGETNAKARKGNLQSHLGCEGGQIQSW